MASGRGTITLKVEGLTELRALIQADEMFKDIAQEALEDVGRLGVNAARAKAPRGETGQLAARLSYKVSKAARWVVIKTDAVAKAPAKKRGGKRSKGWKYPYPYPRRLEFDSRSRHKDWLKHAIEPLMPRVEGILKKAAERRWDG